MAFAVHITASTSYDVVAGSYEEARELALSQFDNETFSDNVNVFPDTSTIVYIGNNPGSLITIEYPA